MLFYERSLVMFKSQMTKLKRYTKQQQLYGYGKLFTKKKIKFPVIPPTGNEKHIFSLQG